MRYSFVQACLRMLALLTMVFQFSTAGAQGLQIGDPIISAEVKRILNYSSDHARLTDFVDGKALLIDFWFTTCTSCIESFPKLDSIQKEFKDDLNILLVTFETEEKTIRTFNTINRIRHVKLPSVVQDTLLHLIFPHTSAPHEIWVDKTGIIKAITDHRPVNRENIRRLIAGEELNLPVKKDNMGYAMAEPLIDHIDRDKLIKHSLIASHDPGLPASTGLYIHPDNGFLVSQATNGHLRSLYILAYNQWAKGFNYNRFIIDETVLKRCGNPEGDRNVYCYDAWWKDTSRASACLEMQAEFDRFFNVKSHTEMRKMPCMVLRQKGNGRRFKSIAEAGREETYYHKDTLFLKNVYLKYPIETIINYGRYSWSPFQFIEETGYEGKVNICLPGKYESIDQVNRFLHDVDLEVSLEERWMEVIVIQDKEKA